MTKYFVQISFANIFKILYNFDIKKKMQKLNKISCNIAPVNLLFVLTY